MKLFTLIELSKECCIFQVWIKCNNFFSMNGNDLNQREFNGLRY